MEEDARDEWVGKVEEEEARGWQSRRRLGGRREGRSRRRRLWGPRGGGNREGCEEEEE